MKIVLADDHRLVLESIETYLTTIRPDIEILQAFNLEEACLHLEKSKDIDLIILDLHMPGMDGFNSVQKILNRHPDLPVVILSGQANGQQIREALKSGAAGFIPKDLSGSGMLSAIEIVLSGDRYIPAAALLGFNDDITSDARPRFSSDNPLSALTPREIEVLGLLVKGRPNKTIAYELGSSDNTVAFHLKNVFRKLEVSSRTQAVGKAIGLGMQV